MTDRIVINNEIINELIKLSITEYGNEAAVSSSSHLRWKYLDNPSGSTYADIIYQGSLMIGRVVYAPRKFVAKGGSLWAVNPIDVLIDGSYRSPANFPQLMQGIRHHDKSQLVYFSPNNISAPLYEKLLKFRPVGTFTLSGIPLRLDRVLTNRVPKWICSVMGVLGIPWRGLVKGVTQLLRLGVKVSLVSNQPSAADVDLLNSHFLESPVWVGDRSATFHQWRFYDGPRFIYRVRYAFSNNELVGYLVARIADFEGMRAAVILDCVVRPGSSSRVSRALLADAVNWALLEKADLVATLSYGSSAIATALRRFPLFRIPKKMSPQKMAVLAEWLNEKRDNEDPDISLTLADLDVF